MLGSGREAPEVEADESHVRVAFAAPVDSPGLVRALSLLPDVIGAAATANLNVLLALRHLTQAGSPFIFWRSACSMEIASAEHLVCATRRREISCATI